MILGINEYVLFILGVASFLLAIEFGFILGNKHALKEKADPAPHFASLQQALLGLLALLLSFTFAMSIERFDTRKHLVVEEANAIGTAYLRADFLPISYAAKIKTQLSEYVDARLDFYYAGNDKARVDAATAHAAALLQELWNHSVAAVKASDNPVAAGLFIAALNDVIDLNEKRLKAFENHVPEAVIALLFLVSVVGMGFIGYNYGLTGKRRHGSTALFALLIASVLIIILDIDRPRRGFIRVSQASLERLQASLNAE